MKKIVGAMAASTPSEQILCQSYFMF